MTPVPLIRLAAGLGAVALVTACGRSETTSQPVPQAPATAATAPSRGQPAPPPPPPPLVNMMPTPAPVAPVAPDALGALLPEIAGWTRSAPRLELVPTPAAYSRADVHYARGDATIELVLADSGFQPLVLAPISVHLASGSAEASRDTLRRSITIGGSPGSEIWSTSNRHGEVLLLVGQRFTVTATGRQVPDLEPVRAAVRAVDLARLGRLR